MRMLRSRWIRVVAAVALVAALAPSGGLAPDDVLAFPCLVDGGVINAKDSQAAGFPGDDDPLPDRFWGPDDIRHHMELAEWCEHAHDWLRDKQIRWSANAVAWIKDKWNNGNNFMIFEQLIVDEHQYNARGVVDSDLPWVNYYIADIFEQGAQGYEEAGWWLRGGSAQLVAGRDYHAYAQWDQELSPMDFNCNWDSDTPDCFREFLSQAEEVNRFYFDIDGVDPVGKATGKKWNQ